LNPWIFLPQACRETITSGSVKALLPASSDRLRLTRVGSCLGACAVLSLASCKKNEPIDEAKAAGVTTADFPQITADIFKPMDGGMDVSPKEIMGRHTWNLWSRGNQNFWNRAAQDSYGLIAAVVTVGEWSTQKAGILVIALSVVKEHTGWALEISLFVPETENRKQIPSPPISRLATL
jgi:hypothetical protein